MAATASTGYAPTALSPGKHDRRRTIKDSIRHICDLRSSRQWILDHGFQHLGRGDDDLASLLAALNESLF